MEDAVVAAAGGKRRRDCGEVEDGIIDPTLSSPSLPDAKRIRADLFLDILDDESEPDNTDLDSVMRSLEEELGQPAAAPGSDPVPTQPDLGFLLEASDDELGLPPPESSSGELAGAAEDEACGGVADEGGFGKIWGLDDEIHLDFGFGSGEVRCQDNGGDDGGAIFDGGLFDYDGGFCGLADFSDLTWRPEYLPAV